MRKSATVKAIYESDLRRVLQSLGILDKLIGGEMNCAICGCPVVFDNLGTVFPEGNDVGVSCDNNRCVRAVTTGSGARPSG